MTSAIVELDVFSGRPNPRWTLHADVLIALQGMIGLLERATAGVEAPNQLGYRGVSVWADQGRGLVQLCYVGGGYVFLPNEADGPPRIDAARRIERTLLESGIGSVDRALLAGILAAMR